MYEVYKYEKLKWYPHMGPRDVSIWERFIEKNPDAYETVQYDYRVGDPPPFNTLTDEGDDWKQDALYRLRIDVVGKLGNHVDIVEVKPDAGPSTIGQVESYKTLYMRDQDVKTTVGLVIVTDVERPNMRYLCEGRGIKLIVV